MLELFLHFISSIDLHDGPNKEEEHETAADPHFY